MNSSLEYQEHIALDRLGLKLTARLSDACDNLPYEVTERLRAARTRSVAQRKITAAPHVVAVSATGAATLGVDDEGLNIWSRLGAALPLLALVFGLIAIDAMRDDQRANDLAEIDAAILSDALPPAAYTDAGFSQFLKVANRSGQGN